MRNPIDILEINELMQKLKDEGYGEIIDCLLENEQLVYTKKGRLNKSSACRKLGVKNKELDDVLLKMREILAKDFS